MKSSKTWVLVRKRRSKDYVLEHSNLKRGWGGWAKEIEKRQASEVNEESKTRGALKDKWNKCVLFLYLRFVEVVNLKFIFSSSG